MFAEYSFGLQLAAWGALMGSLGYMGGACPFSGLAILGLLGLLGGRGAGITWTGIAALITICETVLFLATHLTRSVQTTFGGGYTPLDNPVFFGKINLFLAVITLFVLLYCWRKQLPPAHWISLAWILACYGLGSYFAVQYWFVGVSHVLMLFCALQIFLLCRPGGFTAGLWIGIAFLAVMIGFFVHEYLQAAPYKHARNLQQTFLHAAQQNKQDQVQNLLQDSRLDEDTKKYALLDALTRNQAEMLALLIRSYDAETMEIILNDLIEKEEADKLNKLLQSGAKPSAKNVTVAVYRENLPLVKLLIEHGAPLNAWEDSPLAAAANQGSLPIFHLLLQTHKNGQETIDTALEKACNGYAYEKDTPQYNEIVRTLISQGARPEYKSVLECAGQMPTEILQLLLEKGADVNQKDRDGRVPLFQAVQRNNLKNTELLLKHGAAQSLAERDWDGMTILDYANTPEMKQLLSSYGEK